MDYLELKQKDTIILENEQIQYVIDAYQKFKDDLVNIFLRNGVIRQREKGQLTSYLYFELIAEILYNIEFYVMSEGTLTHIFTLTLNPTKKKNFAEIKYINSAIDKSEINNFINVQLMIFAGTFYFIENMLAEQETETKEIKTKHKKNKIIKASKTDKKTIVIKNKHMQYINLNISDDSFKKLKKHRKRQYQGSWSVKGHLRHYKSGKVGYVRPYIKGEGEFKSKNYKISID